MNLKRLIGKIYRFKIFKSLCNKVELVTSYLFDLSQFLFFALAIMLIELIKSEIMEKLRIIIREAALV